MRYSILQLLAILGLGLFAACSSDFDSGRGVNTLSDSRVVELSYKLLIDKTVQSRATEPGTDNENDIRDFQAFIFDENQDLIRLFRIGDGIETLGKSKLRLLIAEDDVGKYENNELQLVLIANYNVDLGINSFLDLQNHLLNTNFNEDTPSTFVMTGSLILDGIEWAEDNPVFEVQEELTLIRVAAKVQLQIRDINVYDKVNNAKVYYELVSTPKVRFINYSANSSLLPGSLLRDSVLSSTDYIEMESFGAGYILPQAYYSYESDWSTVQGLDASREAHLMLKLVFKSINGSGVDGEEKDYFYHIPINYRFPTAEMSPEEVAQLYKIQRNHLYSITSSISQLGTEDEREPFDLSPEISVGPWVDREIDGDIGIIHFLIVEDRYSTMPNINQIQIDYKSSLPIDIFNIKTQYTSHDSAGSITIVTDMEPDQLIIKDVDSLNHINVINPIPTNFVPLEIFFTVRHKYGSNLSLDVHIIQYPPKYITATTSTGYVNSTEPSPYADFRFHNTLGMFATSADGGGSPQTNNVFYQIRTLVNTDDELIGDPTTADGFTRRDENSNLIISPQFIIATQHGVSDTVSQYALRGNKDFRHQYFRVGFGSVRDFPDYSTYTLDSFNYNFYYAHNYRSASERCANYFEDEYGMDGYYDEYYINTNSEQTSRKVYKTFKYQGKWRIPTMAELKYIDRIQDNPQSQVKSLLWGDWYWSAQEGLAYSFDYNYSQNSNVANVRCVFDTWKLKDYE